MKKIIQSIVLFFSVFILTACSQSTHEQLQENQWQVVSDNGESYTANFFEDTVSFKMGVFEYGYQYSITNDDDTEKIQMIYDDDDKPIFEIQHEDNYIKFIADNDEVYEQYGNLTLTALENNEN